MIMYARHLSSSHEATFLKLELHLLEILTLLIKCADSFRCKLFIMDNDDYRDVCEIWKGCLQSYKAHHTPFEIMSCLDHQGSNVKMPLTYPDHPSFRMVREGGGQNMPERFGFLSYLQELLILKQGVLWLLFTTKTQDNNVQGLVITPSSCMS